MFKLTRHSVQGNAAAGVFKDANDLRKNMMADIENLGYDVRDFYKEEGHGIPRSHAVLLNVNIEH